MINKTVRAVRQSSRLLRQTGMLLKKSEEVMRGPIHAPESFAERSDKQAHAERSGLSILGGLISNVEL